jgi:hypothetical protein
MRRNPHARALAAGALAAAVLATTGCGGTRQDADEPAGDYRVRVTDASFPAKQTIAQPARLRIEVRNADTRAVPNVAVTVQTKPRRAGAAPLAFAQATTDTRLADSGKPIWIVDSGPAGGDSAYTNTWALGALRPGETKTFEWRLIAVKPGTYTVDYRVAPGLDGKARVARGERAKGAFEVTISDEPVPSHVGDDGNVIRGEEAGSGSSDDGL